MASSKKQHYPKLVIALSSDDDDDKSLAMTPDGDDGDDDGDDEMVTDLPTHEPRPRNLPLEEILPADEIEERLALAKKMAQTLTDFYQGKAVKLEEVEFAAVLVCPLAFLRELAEDPAMEIRDRLKAMETLVKFFQFGHRADPRFRAQNRSRAEGLIRDSLDNERCVISDTESPQKCHIIPFAANAGVARREQIASALKNLTGLLFAEAAEAKQAQRWFGDIYAISNGRAWNMISLSNQLQCWWGQAHFGLKYHGIRPCQEDNRESIIEVQFVWMPRRDDPRATLEREAGEILESFHSPVAIKENKSGRLLKTGDMYDIRVLSKDGDKMQQALDIQWTLVRIAAISGHVEEPELLGGRVGEYESESDDDMGF
ncbi:hypothetical protein B0T25DRAFT_541923 [Lasiosphaeria hispida]|uniref:HNH nuclease domain-containing protein n=1 Tax=Lasiosphaeria hispida TaxID=260671 RepID=A0AAJ0HH97_9PEZI|nr:hypothetical protein B0T25DRAFT_541923 [Lasiosphaeria hispida]